MDTEGTELELSRLLHEGNSGSPEEKSAVEVDDIRFEDIFFLNDMQRLQDAFAASAQVASVITTPDGRPLTRPSNFTIFCQHVVRGTAKGLANCMRSDALLGQNCQRNPTCSRCSSAGLLDGATSITVGDKQIAIWLIGQVIDESVDLEEILAYGHEIGVDEATFRQALNKVPRMSHDRFDKLCQTLHQFASHLSSLALKAHQQSFLIENLRRTQARLKIRDRNLADIIEFLPDPTMVIDEKGAVLFWNRAMEKLTGVPGEKILGRSQFEYGLPFYGMAAPILIDYARGAVASPDTRYTVVGIEEDGIIAEVTLTGLPGGIHHVWAKAVALRDESGHVIGGIETIRDVTDRHKANMALRESEEKFRRIVETAHEGVWVVDASHATTFVNHRMATILGYQPEEMHGRHIEEFVADDFRGKSLWQQERLRQGHSDVYEHRLQTKSGEYRWMLVSASPLYDAKGTYLGSLGMFTDITARKRVEEELANHRQRLEVEVETRTRDLRLQALELAEANIRLSELDRLKSAFLSTVSHELRTPLTSILGFAKLISRDFAEHFLPLVQDSAHSNRGRRIVDNLAVVYREAERLTRLINDVLDLSRIESGNMYWRDVQFDALSVLQTAVRNIEGLLGQRPEITFTFTADGSLPQLCMDPDQLLQVVSNLMQNALKFTKSGTVHMEVRRDGHGLLLTVADSGIGIPAGELEAIFEKFHRVERGDTLLADNAKGTGLGLAICRQIIRHYGGRIWAESELGRGSTFYVHLPAGEDERQQEQGINTPDAATSVERP